MQGAWVHRWGHGGIVRKHRPMNGYREHIEGLAYIGKWNETFMKGRIMGA